MSLKPQETAQFLQCLGGDSFVFQTFTDSDEQKEADINRQKELGARNPRDSLAKVLIGTFDHHIKELIQLNIQGAGVFVQVNRGNKRGKGHIKGINVLFLDLDNVETAKESLLSVQKYMPKPTAVINSSTSKYHIYWKVLDCKLEDFKKMQLSLAVRFNSDLAMVNLDRVMRLPGFAHKKYEPVISKIVMTSENVYTVDQLYQAASKAPTLAPASNGTAKNEVQSDPLKKDVFGLDIGSDYELPTSTPREGRNHALIKYVGHLIGTGMRDEKELQDKVRKMNNKFEAPLPENELEATTFQSLAKYAEESKVEDTKRAQTALDTKISAAQTPPSPPVKEGVVPTPPPEVEAPADYYQNNFVYVVVGQRVINKTHFGAAAILSKADFRGGEETVREGGKEVAVKWLKNPNRDQVDDITWKPVPGEKVIWESNRKLWNQYQDPNIEAVSKEDFTLESLDMFFEHMRNMFPVDRDCSSFLDWLTFTILRPADKIKWAPLLVSTQGIGKGWIFTLLQELLGFDNVTSIKPGAFDGSFNGFVNKKVLVLVDEMRMTLKGNSVDSLKMSITEDTVTVNEKHVKEETVRTYANFLCFTNHPDAVPLEDTDRRFWVLSLPWFLKGWSEDHHRDYFERLWSWLYTRDSRGIRTLRVDNISQLKRWCMDRDLSKFSSNHIPYDTEAKNEMRENSRISIEAALRDAIEDRLGPFKADVTSLIIAKQFMEVRESVELIGTDGKLFEKIWRKYSTPIHGGGVRIVKDAGVDNQGGKQVRVRSIRNHESWAAAEKSKVGIELTRSMQLSITGNKNILPPILEIVEGDTNAKSSKS